MTYGDLRVGRVIENTHTGVAGRVESLGNGLVDVLLQTGPQAGETISVSPEALLPHWEAVN